MTTWTTYCKSQYVTNMFVWILNVWRRIAKWELWRRWRQPTIMEQQFGCVADLYDEYDLVWAPDDPQLGDMSKPLLLCDKHMVFKMSQKLLGTSAACAVAFILNFQYVKKYGITMFKPSRMFLHYNSAMCSLRSTLRAVSRYGVCGEHVWPYMQTNLDVRPDARCYTEALDFPSVSYLSVPQNVDALLRCLQEGHPIAFQTTLTTDAGNQGRAAAVIVGYTCSQTFVVKTFMHTDNIHIPFDVMDNPKACSDFWIVSFV